MSWLIAIIVPVVVLGLKFAITLWEDDSSYKETWESFQTQHFILWDKKNKGTKLIDIKGSKIARVTFERFLNLYKISPEKWIIETGSDVPIYHNNSEYIPLYWIDAKELVKYEQWLYNNYMAGEEPGCEQARDESLKRLNNYLQQDLKEKRAEFEKEMAEFEEQFKQDRERAKEKHKIELKLELETKPQTLNKNKNVEPIHLIWDTPIIHNTGGSVKIIEKQYNGHTVYTHGYAKDYNDIDNYYKQENRKPQIGDCFIMCRQEVELEPYPVIFNGEFWEPERIRL